MIPSQLDHSIRSDHVFTGPGVRLRQLAAILDGGSERGTCRCCALVQKLGRRDVICSAAVSGEIWRLQYTFCVQNSQNYVRNIEKYIEKQRQSTVLCFFCRFIRHSVDLSRSFCDPRR